ncbi:GNAT family N-acetyltransferase, partial [Riemerella anatipestifer]|nr:GNAT family N-acetyltransferase [Riemerella anatipestifer]
MFQPARIEDIDIIWEMLQQGIRRRKEDGSNQWQDGYPNRRVVEK